MSDVVPHRVFLGLEDLGMVVTERLGPHVPQLDAPLAAAVCKGVALLWVEPGTRDHLHQNATWSIGKTQSFSCKVGERVSYCDANSS